MAERHDLRPKTVEPILDLGSVNHVFVVRSNKEAYVVRFARDPLRQKGFDLERWCLEQATAHHIPSPRIVASGVHLGVPYLIQSYVDGSPGTATRSLALWATLGRYGRIVHHIPLTQDPPESLFSRFGRDLPSAWQAHLSYNLEALNPADPLLAWGVYASGDQARLRSLVRELGQLPTSFGLNHGDLSFRNVLVPDAGAPVLIDWGSAAAGPTPYGDLLNLLKMHRSTGDPSMEELTTFADGSGLRLAAVLPILEDLLVLSLLDLVRWAADRRPDLLVGHIAAARTGIAELARS